MIIGQFFATKAAIMEGVVKREWSLEVTPNREDVVEQFAQIKGWVTNLSDLMRQRESLPFDSELTKIETALRDRTMRLLKKKLGEFERAIGVSAHTTCRRSRDIHVLVAILVMLESLSHAETLFRRVQSAFQRALEEPTYTGESRIYRNNIRYRLGSITALTALDHGVSGESLLKNATLELRGLAEFLTDVNASLHSRASFK